MNKSATWVLLLLLVVSCGGCATLSEGQCVTGDWYTIGNQDGMRGAPQSRLFEHSEACAKYGTQPDVAAYDVGRRDGLKRYCTPQQGFAAGREGRAYHGVCRGQAEGAFLAAYSDGKEIYDAREWLERIERDLHSTESQLDKDDLSDKERKRLHNRLRDLRHDRRRAREQLDRVTYRYDGRDAYYR